MNAVPKIEHHFSACPHDCPSVCALEVEVIDGRSIGRIHGAKDQSYTDGVVCAKVARYAERIHHEERLLYPLKRIGPKGAGAFARISWDEALDTIAQKFLEAERDFGAESVWPYYYGGTMGRVMRTGINRLTHAKKYSRFHATICINMAWTGFLAGTGKMAGPDPREMAKADCVVIWGTNAAATQVNVMVHAVRARKERGAKIVVIDIYKNTTMEQADLALCLRPGTDGALACAVMHVLFRDGYADWDYLERSTDQPRELEAHLADKTPQWAARITGLSVEEIETFAHLVGQTKKTFFRLGYGFSRQRNGAANMHAALSVAAVTGAWLYEGGGAFHNNGAVFHFKQTLIDGLDVCDTNVRSLDQSRIGPILTGDPEALKHGGPVKAMFIQNTNPMAVAPEQSKVRAGFMREDLFVAVHEQFMTETAALADIVLPATMFLEHDDLYLGGGHQYLEFGPKLIDPPGECRNNHEVICDLAHRLGANHPGFDMSARGLLDAALADSGWPNVDALEAAHWIDAQPDFAASHYLDGFAWPDKKFRFKPDWPHVPFAANHGLYGAWQNMPALPDHWQVLEEANEAFPFRLATSPARQFLNSSFNETPTGRRLEGMPKVRIHPGDAADLAVGDGDKVILANERGEVRLFASYDASLRPGVLVSEGLMPNSFFEDGQGINTLTSAEPVAPFGGAAFHDTHVSVRKASN
jgi:anaerobic selenocysteine-containing dehydrogenase